MNRTHRAAWANEVVPLSQRLSYLDAFRAIAVGLVIGAWLLGQVEAPNAEMFVSTAAYLGAAVLGGALWRILRRRGLTLFGALILVDGIYLAWVSHITGGMSSPFRYLIILHLVTVTLLASYNTGLKLALWHTLLLLIAYNLDKEGILPAPGVQSADVSQMAAFMVVFWLAALLTATFAAVNERELRRRKVDVEALAVMAAELDTTTDLASVADVLANNVQRHFGLHRVVVLTSGPAGLRLAASAGTSPSSTRPFVPRGASVLVESMTKRVACLIGSVDPGTDKALSKMIPDAKNVAIFPLTAEAKVVGLLIAEFGGAQAFRVARREIEMLDRFASHGALALHSADLLHQLKQLASTDELTSLANRRTFDSVLAREVQRAARNEQPLSLIIADIDRFKRLNDKFGHKAGDRVLGEVASVLSGNVRAVDTVARYGGEEFAIVMPGCEPQEAAKRAEQLRKAMAGIREPHVTVSFGVASFPAHAPNAEGLIEAADTALYESKANGRNTFTVYGGGRPSGVTQKRRGARSDRRRSESARRGGELVA